MPPLTPRRRSALLWGLVGALSFLVGHGAYLLAGGTFLGFGPIAVVSLSVFAAAATSSYYAERRFGLLGRRIDGSE